MSKTKTADVVVMLEGLMYAVKTLESRDYTRSVVADALDFGHDQWVNLLQYYRLDVLEYLAYNADPGKKGIRFCADMVGQLTRHMEPYDVYDFGNSRIKIVRTLLEDVGVDEYMSKLSREMVLGAIADARRWVEIRRLKDQCKEWNDHLGELVQGESEPADEVAERHAWNMRKGEEW